MWMNLDTLPAGKSMFTLALTTQPVDTPEDERWIEEMDVVFNSRASIGTLLTYAMSRPDWPFDESARLVGVADQSAGEMIAQSWEGVAL